MKEIIVSAQEQGQRLDKFLLKYFNTAPKSFVYKMLRKKRIKYNGGRAQGGELITAGDTLTFYLSEETMDGFMEERSLPKATRHFAVLYEDEQILAVSKPAGLLTHPESPEDQDTLIDQVLYYLFEKGEYLPKKDSAFTPALCNRLDRNTSGVILAGKTLPAVQALNQALAARKTEKVYLALVTGVLKGEGSFTGWHSKDPERNQAVVSQRHIPGSREMITKRKALFYNENCTLLAVKLVTGRSHQIRAHLSAVGHPLIGDRKYGQGEINRQFKEKYGLSNQFLHAYRISFAMEEGTLSYLNGKSITAPLPGVLARIYHSEFPDAPEEGGFDIKFMPD